MGASTVDISSQALELLGENAIGSFTESRVAATAGRLIDDRINALLGAYPWRFAQRQAVLQLRSAAPSQEWKFAHDLPSGIVSPGLMALKASNAINAPVIKEFEIFGKEVHSNQPALFAEYTIKPPESQWPPHFYQLCIYAMAEHLAMPVTEDRDKRKDSGEVAFGTPSEGGMGGYFATARRIDSQQQPTQVIEDFSLIEARFGSIGLSR